MKIEDISFRLKDGRQALLCSPREEDIHGTLEYLRRSAAETEFLLRTPEDCSRYTVEKEREVFAQKNASPDSAMILCLVEGVVAGNAEISFSSREKTRHRAEIGIAILRAYWNQGIGTRLFEEMIRLARARQGVRQIELCFIEGNERGRHLYEKMGFRITGVHPNAFRMRDGSLRHEYLMTKELCPVASSPKDDSFWAALDELAAASRLVIDRPKGSGHPRYEGLPYPLDYGYLEGTSSPDGGGIDVWRGSDPAGRIDGVICTLDLIKRDSEIKLLVGCTEEERARALAFHNRSPFMKGIWIARPAGQETED